MTAKRKKNAPAATNGGRVLHLRHGTPAMSHRYSHWCLPQNAERDTG